MPRSRRARRDDRAAQGCAEPQPRANAREHAGVDSRRPVRQHRARLQFGDCDEDGAEARRLRRHRGGLRRGSGRGEVHRHQVPEVRVAARPRRAGRDAARAQVPRRRRCRRPHARESAGAGEGSPEPRAPHQQRAQPLRPALHRRDQPVHVGHRCRDRAAQKEDRASRCAGRRCDALGRWRRRRRGARPHGGRCDRPRAGGLPARLRRSRHAVGEDAQGRARRSTGRPKSPPTARSARRSRSCRRRATATIRSASRRRSTRSRPTRCSTARRPGTWSTSAKCVLPRARNSS